MDEEDVKGWQEKAREENKERWLSVRMFLLNNEKVVAGQARSKEGSEERSEGRRKRGKKRRKKEKRKGKKRKKLKVEKLSLCREKRKCACDPGQ